MTRCLFLAASIALTAPALAADGPDAAPVLQKGNAKKEKKGKKGGGGGRDITASAGTKQLGGSATLGIASAGGNTAVAIDLSPEFGYFVADGLEVFGSVSIGYIGGVSWGLGAGGRYFIDLSPNWLYVDAGFGYGAMTVSNGVTTSSVGVLTIAPGAGLLMPLGKNVALDVGTVIGVSLISGTTAINVPIGMLGVQAFFD